jgi:sec-independent protein translocase protein TatA
MISRSLAFIAVLCVWSVHSFAPMTPDLRSRQSAHAPFVSSSYVPASLQRQRKSVAAVQTMGLFGLGAPEVAIILVAAAFLLGPQKLAELGKDAGKIAGELKEVPKEFQKGLTEGEELAKINKKTKPVSVDAAKDADAE